MSFFDILELQSSNNRNYILKDKKAYTEDNVLVYNIFVYGIPIRFTENEIRCYFSKFGTITKVRLVADKRKSQRSTLKIGFVNFAETFGAYSALAKSNHRLQGSRIGVKAGDSWNQPNAEKACSLKQNDTEMASTSNQSKQTGQTRTKTKQEFSENSINDLNVLSLNDDCLEMICSLLELGDQVRFGRVCQRFCDVFQMVSKREFKKFQLDKLESLTLWEMRDLFRFVGQNIEEVSGSLPETNRERIIEFIRTFCRNLKWIKLFDCKIRPNCLKSLLRALPQLQGLQLHDCSLNDNSILALQHLKRLESLAVSESFELTGKHLSELVQLKSLNLYGCSNIQTSNLINICKALQDLNTLDIRRCERLSAKFFNVMVDNCKQLEVLKMSCTDFSYERVALLPKLKHLELMRISSGLLNFTPLLVELVAHKADQFEILKLCAKNSLTAEDINLISKLTKLKKLSCIDNQMVNDEALRKFSQRLEQLEVLVISGCSDITNEGLLKVVRSCKHLQCLTIQFCRNVTYEFISKVITILRGRCDARKKPFEIWAYGTSIDQYGMLLCEEYTTAVKDSLIKVEFQISYVDLTFDKHMEMVDFWHGEGWLYDEYDDDYPTDEDDDFYFAEWDEDDEDNNAYILGELLDEIYFDNW